MSANSKFQHYMSGGDDKPLNTPPHPLDEEPKAEIPVAADHDQYHKKAKALVAQSFNETFFPGIGNPKATAKDFYVVWFAKVLGNWKALVSTDLVSSQYWEVTYDGNKKQTYVDHYIKRSNVAISDSEYAAMS